MKKKKYTYTVWTRAHGTYTVHTDKVPAFFVCGITNLPWLRFGDGSHFFRLDEVITFQRTDNTDNK
jgi:hypothetical protein